MAESLFSHRDVVKIFVRLWAWKMLKGRLCCKPEAPRFAMKGTTLLKVRVLLKLVINLL